MKTPEELARNYCEPILSDEYAKAIGREDWIGTKCVWVGEGHEMYKAFLAGYKAAQEHAHAALEEAEAKMQELQDQLADADKVMPQWISVKDRLPRTGVKVLVYLPAYKSQSFGILWKGEWGVGEAGALGRMAAGLTVTHWMPLPEPPKELP